MGEIEVVGGRGERRERDDALRSPSKEPQLEEQAQHLVDRAAQLVQEGRLQEASELLHEAIAIREALDGGASAETGALQLRLANMHHAAGDLEGASAWLGT